MDKNTLFICIFIVFVILLIVGIVLYIKHLNSKQKDNYSNCNKSNIRENFNTPSISNANLLYTDQYGNMGATSNVGINSLAVSNGTQISGGATIDTLNVTSSITSPTISNINSKIAAINTTLTTINSTLTSLQNQITTNTNTLKGVSNDGTGNITTTGNISVTGNISATGNIKAGDSLKFADGYWTLSSVNLGTIRFTRQPDQGFADIYLSKCNGSGICGTQKI
jgi:hypothetical protein